MIYICMQYYIFQESHIMMEKITVLKEVTHLLHDGFKFRKVRIMSDGNTSWRCVKSRCSSRLRVDEKDNVISSSEHSHEQGRTETKDVVSEIRKKSGEKLLIPQSSGSSSAYSTSDRVEKKMILIEPRQLNECMERKTLSRSDSEILHGERQTLFKPNIVAKVKDMQESAAKQSVKESGNFESTVIDTVPKTWKSRASRLLKHIKLIPHIRWSKKGELIVKNKTLPETHAVDLINDLLRKRTSSPNGWQQITTALKGHSIPRELIGNSERWRYKNKPQKKTKATTPLRPKSHTKTGLAWEVY